MVRQREAVHEQQLVLKEEPTTTLDEMRANQGGQGYSKRKYPKQCSRCGRGQHPWEKRPARDAWCHRCKRKEHFMGQCHSKTVAPVYNEDSPDSAMDSAFLGAIGTNQEPTWKMKLQLSGQETEFKLDTGAEVTAISDQTFQGIAGCQLTAPSKKLYGPARNALKVIGKFEGTIAYQERTSKQTQG